MALVGLILSFNRMLKPSESWADSSLALGLVCVHTGYMWSNLVGAMVEKKSGLVVQYHPWLVTYDEWLALANRQQVMYEASESERWSRRCGQQMRRARGMEVAALLQSCLSATTLECKSTK